MKNLADIPYRERDDNQNRIKTTSLALNWALALLLGSLIAGPAVATKPEWAGQGKGSSGKNEGVEQHDDGRREHRNHDDRSGERRHHFNEKNRVVVREYYREEFRGGRCPPGLAKKHNGCLPPGQAKKWHYGRPLPHDIMYYEVPPDVVVRIGGPPSGYRYVRIASDILLIAVGTNVVVDAIEDLGR
jgi:hypothetical protein